MTDAPPTAGFQFPRLFEAAKDGMMLLDGETGEITAVNPRLTALLGYDPSEILGKHLWEISALRRPCACLHRKSDLRPVKLQHEMTFQ